MDTVVGPANVNSQQIRRFRPARVVALVVITAMAMVLVSLRFTSGEQPVTVPEGATAGDVALEPCTYPTEDGPVDAECGTLVVAENPAEADSPLLALPVVRIRARSATPGEPIFWIEGGPGLSNMDLVQASRFVGDRDLVMVGYRGVDGSVRLDCPEVVSVYQRATDMLSEEFFTARDAALRACAARFAADGVDPSRYGLVQQIDDLEVARAALGYERINLFSASAGTRTALVYGWRHPERIHRSVMAGVNPPGNFLWDPDTIDEQMRRYAEVCAADAVCRTRTNDLAAAVRDLAADPPERWLLWPIEGANLQAFSIVGLTESTARVMPPDAPATLDAWLSAAEGDASGLWLVSVLVDQLYPYMGVWGQHLAFASIDADAARDYFAAPPPDGYANFGWAAMSSVFSGGLAVTTWPTDPVVEQYRQARTSQVETLLINGELDFVTAPQRTADLLPLLPNGHEVVLDGVGHNYSFWTIQPEAGSRLINTFYDSGTVDDSLYEPFAVDLTPSPALGTVARILVGMLVALAVIMMASLVATARRVRRRGAFGPVPGALLRSVYPVVLGLGGWSLGVLLVLLSGRPIGLDNQLLAALSVGAPVGLGIGWAWRGAATARSRALAASVAGALAGAWLGFHAIGGFAGFLTAILGALLAANLVLIALDIARERVEPRAAPPVATKPTRAPAHT
jgi:pimeloyl-ACP methyl ester carboxylesterase